MIKLKARPGVPAILISDEVLDFVEDLKRRVELNEDLKSTDFEGKYWRNDYVRKPLFEMHYNGKCCYCERRRDEKRELDVEHFRPKAEVTGERSHPGYWWLAYKWDNYFYSCKKCNEDYKKNLFPLIDETMRVYHDDGDISSESPLLINPELEDPEDFISYEWEKAYGVFVKAYGVDPNGRGDATITITGLNEGTLPEERAELVELFDEIVETIKWARHHGNVNKMQQIGEIIRRETKADKVFCGFRRAFFKGNGLEEYISPN